MLMVVPSVPNLDKGLLKFPPHSMAKNVTETTQSLDIVSLMNVEDLPVFPVWLDHLDSPVSMVPLDPKASPDKTVLPDNVVLKDLLDLKDLPVSLDPKETPVCKDFQDPRALWVNLDLVVRLENKETLDPLDLPENLDHLVVLVLLDLLDLEDPLETMVFLVTKVFLGLLVLLVSKACLARLVLVVFLDLKENLDPVDKLLKLCFCLLMFKQDSNLLTNRKKRSNVTPFGIHKMKK